MSGESHFHPCLGCQQAVECLLAIGDGDCGKLRCDSCSTPKLKPNKAKDPSAGHTLSNTWVCVNGCLQPSNEVTECPRCKAPKPKVIGTCANCDSPISEYYPDKCWYGHPYPSSKAIDSDVADEVEAESCDNCAEYITPENPVMEWDGDLICRSCYPDCIDCNKPLDSDNYYSCHICESYVCAHDAQYCQCCEEHFCKSHAEGHGI